MRLLIKIFIFLSAGVALNAMAYDFSTSGLIAGLAGAGIGLTVFVGAVPALITVAIGAVVMGIAMPANPNVPNDMPIVAQISPSAQFDTPSGWTAPATGSSQPSPPSTAPMQSGFAVTNGAIYSTEMEACTAKNSLYTHITTNSSQDYCTTADNLTEPVFAMSACPAGYGNNAGTCTLSNPSLVQKPSDGVCGIIRSGNTFATDTQDPDCASGKIPSSTTITSNSISKAMPDGTNKTITINSDGTTSISESRPNYTTNSTETNITNVGIPDASGNSKITGQGQGVAPGTGTAAGTSTTPTQFDKSGLATEPTQQAIHTDTTAIVKALTDTTPGDPIPTTGLDTVSAAHQSAINAHNNLSAPFAWDWVPGLPASCGCQPLNVGILGSSTTYDWCPQISKIRDLLGWFIYIITGYALLSLAIRKPA